MRMHARNFCALIHSCILFIRECLHVCIICVSSRGRETCFQRQNREPTPLLATHCTLEQTSNRVEGFKAPEEEGDADEEGGQNENREKGGEGDELVSDDGAPARP